MSDITHLPSPKLQTKNNLFSGGGGGDHIKPFTHNVTLREQGPFQLPDTRG